MDVPAGPHQLLELIGRDQITLAGRWPNITYDFDVLPGVDNNLGRPLFLPQVNDGISLPLDNSNTVTQDTVFELPIIDGAPPIRVTARAGTHVSFPPDVTDKRLSVTRIPGDRVPMVLEDGRATNLYISVQPSGAIFDQPLMISFPNVDAQPPNARVLLMSFDHDAGRYVQVGTGHVTEDGKSVTSDPGSGIRVGAWHALPPPPPQPEVTVLGHIQIAGNPIFDKKAIIDIEAWVEGARAVLTSSPDAVDRLDYRATYSIPPGSSVSLAKMESTASTLTLEGGIELIKNPDSSSTTSPLARSAPASFSALGQQEIETGEAIRYGGSIDALSDPLILRAKPLVGQDLIVVKYEWSATGTGADAYTPPTPSPDASVWDLGRAQLPAGKLNVKLVRYVKSAKRRGPVTKFAENKEIEIGVRTDDLIVLGYIDRDSVPISVDGVKSPIYADMPVDGIVPPNSLESVRCNEAIAHLTFNDIEYFEGDAGMFGSLNELERMYILNWMFKFAGSNSPLALTGGDFQGDDGLVSEQKLGDFIASNTTNYKVLNRLQIKYRQSADGFQFNGSPSIEHSAKSYGARTVGLTKNPCGSISISFPQLTFVPGIFETQQGYADMKTVTQTETFEQISDGSPDAAAIRAFNTLTGKKVADGQTPVFWENVGSQISFPVMFGQIGKVITQPFPTFFIYRNGKLVDVRRQAARPIDHFYPNPYPFGDVPCGLLALVTPGGRCGDAISPPAPGSRVPLYVEDLLHPIP